MAKEFSLEKRKQVYNKFKGRCAYCGNKVEYSKFQVDHITPKYRGSTNSELSKYGISKGSNDIDNLNPSCKSCNSSKSTFTIDKWRKEIYLKIDRIRRDSSTFRLLERFGFIRVKKIDLLFYFEKTKRS